MLKGSFDSYGFFLTITEKVTLGLSGWGGFPDALSSNALVAAERLRLGAWTVL